jgi:hypothetical protein
LWNGWVAHLLRWKMRPRLVSGSPDIQSPAVSRLRPSAGSIHRHLARAVLGKKAMKSLWNGTLRRFGPHLTFGSSGREQIRARDVETVVRWGTQSRSEKKPKRASGRLMMETSGKTTDSGAGHTPEVSGGTFWQGWCRQKGARGRYVVTRANRKRGKSSEGCAPWRTCGSGNATGRKPGGPYGWL